MSTRIVNAISNNTYSNCKDITSVDLQSIPWVNNSMCNAFFNCRNLITVNNINNNVTDMYQTFSRCQNLIDTPTIPNSVTNMAETFSRCYNLVNAPTIPSSVTDMNRTFDSCRNLVNAPEIPNSVTDIDYTFHNCTNLVNAPTIPNSVTLLYGTFRNCYNLVNTPIISNSVTNMRFCFSRCNNLVSITELPNSVISMSQAFIDCVNLIDIPNIPDSVTNMHCTFENCYNLVNAPKLSNSTTYAGGTFRNCHSLVNAPEIPNSVTYMHSTFYNCTNLTTAPDIPNAVTAMAYTFYLCNSLMGDIKILSNQITNAVNCFNGTTLTKNVYIPFKYENGVNTQTYNSFINAGYDELGTSCGVYLKDINLLPSTVTLTVNTTPVDATVTFNTGTISGHSVTVPYNTEVSYTVSKEGYKTSETYTYTVTQDETINAPELEPDEPEVELLLDDETKTLSAGTYKYICIGGGASGQNAINSSRSVTTTQTRLSGGAGGMGGGSGYITYGDFTLDEDTEISFTVGKGGVQTNVLGSGAPIAGGASTITKVSDSSVLGTAGGGKLDYSRTVLKSSSGGSGGAAQSGRYANYTLNNYSSRGPSDGHNGGIGGGNGQPHAYQTDEDAAVWANESGKGYYNAVKSYANNAGVKGSPGTSGGGGIGVSAVQDIITVDFINNMDDTKLQTLYNSIGGGGSGGAATVYDTDTIAGSGGAGGGGGGWFAGEDGAIKSDITTRQATGGNGGDGAILYIKAS